MCKGVWCIQGIFYLKLTYLTLLVVKKFHVTAQTQNLSLSYVAMDIVAISFFALLLLMLHPVIAETQ